MDNLDVYFNASNFGLVEGFFTVFYLALSCAIYYLVGFFESKARNVLNVKLSGIYILLILPTLLNIFNLWCLSEFLIVSEDTKTWVSVAVGTIIVATGVFTLHKIQKAMAEKEREPKAKINLTKKES